MARRQEQRRGRTIQFRRAAAPSRATCRKGELCEERAAAQRSSLRPAPSHRGLRARGSGARVPLNSPRSKDFTHREGEPRDDSSFGVPMSPVPSHRKPRHSCPESVRTCTHPLLDARGMEMMILAPRSLCLTLAVPPLGAVPHGAEGASAARRERAVHLVRVPHYPPPPHNIVSASLRTVKVVITRPQPKAASAITGVGQPNGSPRRRSAQLTVSTAPPGVRVAHTVHGSTHRTDA
ncbi:hypothetical protein DFH09DRAFT_1093155 [Mycena vulgaris]|nr:hypothetical protein DFH09DRAFT_1093155 [Mycena vulgaris]